MATPTDPITFLVWRCREAAEALEPPPSSLAGLVAQFVSRLARALNGLDWLLANDERRTPQARSTFEEQLCKLTAELARTADDINSRLVEPDRWGTGEDAMTMIEREAGGRQNAEGALIGPILTASAAELARVARTTNVSLRAPSAELRDALIDAGASLLDAVSRVPVPEEAG